MINLILLAIVLIGWSCEDIFASLNSKKNNYASHLFFSSLFGSLVLLAYNLYTGAFEKLSNDLLLPLLVFAILNAIALIVYFKALEKGKLAALSPAVSSYVVISILIGITILHEQLNGLQVTFSLLAVLASILTLVSNFKKIKLEDGAILLIVPFLIWGANGYLGKTLTALPESITILAFFALTVLISGVNLNKRKIKTKAATYGFIGGITAVTAWVAFLIGLKTNDYYLWITLSSLFPLISFLVGVLLFKEKLTTRQKLTAALAVIFAAIAATYQ